MHWNNTEHFVHSLVVSVARAFALRLTNVVRLLFAKCMVYTVNGVDGTRTKNLWQKRKSRKKNTTKIKKKVDEWEASQNKANDRLSITRTFAVAFDFLQLWLLFTHRWQPKITPNVFSLLPTNSMDSFILFLFWRSSLDFSIRSNQFAKIRQLPRVCYFSSFQVLYLLLLLIVPLSIYPFCFFSIWFFDDNIFEVLKS